MRIPGRVSRNRLELPCPDNSVLQSDLCRLVLTLEDTDTKTPRLQHIADESDHVFSDVFRSFQCCDCSTPVTHQNLELQLLVEHSDLC